MVGLKPINRRDFLAGAGALAAASALPAAVQSASDYKLRIAPYKMEIAPGIIVDTVAYNGQVPGPVMRLREGVPVTIDVTNASAVPEIVHWHGLHIDTQNDGAMEEGSPMIPAGATQRYSFAPKPAGSRWYHTHAMAMGDLTRAAYTGQFGFLLIEGKDHPLTKGDYDREVLLAVRHWEPSFVPMVDMLRAGSANMPQTSGSDVGYKYATLNQHRLGAGEPLRVKKGERVLMRLLNASATENVVLALPGHSFKVIAMDGNPVPNPKPVEVLSLAVAERVDAIVEMNSPGIWVLGSTLEASRKTGLGIVVEYAGSKGAPVWKDPAPAEWDYTQFANTAKAAEPDETFTLTFRDAGHAKDSKFDAWTINNKSWPDVEPIKVTAGKRYRMVFRNGSGDQHPMHLHRHSFEIAKIGRSETSGLIKDVINVMPLQTVAVDFIANNPGDSLVHCHQQLHMDYGFMTLIKYVG